METLIKAECPKCKKINYAVQPRDYDIDGITCWNCKKDWLVYDEIEGVPNIEIGKALP